MCTPMVSLAESDDEWRQYVIDKLPQLVKNLRPSLLLDELRASHLLSKGECQTVNGCCTVMDQARTLLDLLDYKGVGRLARFCKVLKVSGQEHIVSDVMELPTDHRIWRELRIQKRVSRSQTDEQVCDCCCFIN